MRPRQRQHRASAEAAPKLLFSGLVLQVLDEGLQQHNAEQRRAAQSSAEQRRVQRACTAIQLVIQPTMAAAIGMKRAPWDELRFTEKQRAQP